MPAATKSYKKENQEMNFISYYRFMSAWWLKNGSTMYCLIIKISNFTECMVKGDAARYGHYRNLKRRLSTVSFESSILGVPPAQHVCLFT